MPRLILPAAAQTSRPGTQAEAPQNTDRVITDELITGQFLKKGGQVSRGMATKECKLAVRLLPDLYKSSR